MSQATMKIKAVSEEKMKTVVETGKHSFIIDEPPSMGGTDEGADPLSTLLGVLVSCENVIVRLAANEMNFQLGTVEYEASGNLDTRGLMGDPSVRTYFETVNVKVTLDTEESQERIAELQEKVEARCPIYQTLKVANVDLVSE